MPTNARQGTVILIVVGMAAILLTVFMVILRQVRAEALEGQTVEAEAQARMMLPAALSFICEAARLGNTFDGEGHGWTDVRPRAPGDAGRIGPLGPRQADGTLPTLVTNHGNLGGGANSWPEPGSRYRGDCYVWTRPPSAVRPTAAPNPVQVPWEWLQQYETADAATKGDTLIGMFARPKRVTGTVPANAFGMFPYDPAWRVVVHNNTTTPQTDPPMILPGTQWMPGGIQVLEDAALKAHFQTTWYELLERYRSGSFEYNGGLHLQPISDTHAEFLAGDPTPRQGSTNRAWFRVYREPAVTHDGSGEWFDTVPIAGQNVFIITCGAGATRGFRTFQEADDHFTAIGEANPYPNEGFFQRLRARERILWYRAEWSAFIGNAVDSREKFMATSLGGDLANQGSGHGSPNDFTNMLVQRPFHRDIQGGEQWGEELAEWEFNQGPPLNFSGTFKWIERLPSEPTDGAVEGTGNPIW